MKYYITIIKDRTVDTGEWCVGPFATRIEAKAWGENNPNTKYREWWVDEIVPTEYFNDAMKL